MTPIITIVIDHVNTNEMSTFTAVTLAQRLKHARQLKGWSQAQLAAVADVSQGTVGNIEAGARKSKGSLPQIAEALGINHKWLALGEGHMRDAPPSDLVASLPSDDDFSLVPQLDIAAACGDGKWVDHVVVKGGLAFKRSSLSSFGVPEGAARIIYASGRSMEPTIQDGCVVLLNTAERDPREGRVYAVVQPHDGLVLKRLVMDYLPALGAQAWVMRSDNPDKVRHPDKILQPDDRTMIVGRAVWNDNRL